MAQKKQQINSDEVVEQLVNDHVKLLPNVIRFYSSIDPDQAYSIAMERLHHAAKTYDTKGKTKFSTWMMFKVKFGLQDYVDKYKLAKRRGIMVSIQEPVLVHNEDSYTIEDNLRDDTNYERIVGVLDDVRVLKSCLTALSSYHRKVIVEYFIEGKNATEVGLMFGVSEARIYQIINMSLAVLRDEFRKRDRVRTSTTGKQP